MAGSTSRTVWSGIRSTAASGQNSFKDNEVPDSITGISLSGTIGQDVDESNVLIGKDYGV